MRLLAVSAVLAMLALVALCLTLLIRTNQSQEFREQAAHIREQAAHNCRQLNLVKSAIRMVFDDSEQAALERDGLDESQRTFVIEYYARQRARFADDHCPGSDQPTEGG